MTQPAQLALEQQSVLRPALLAWFDAHKRDLPWRRTTDPYAIWVSEVMLQQTQVDRVIGYFTRFLERFPTVQSLASAPLDDVLSRWSGLGYYSRARNLHRAAKLIVDDHGGRLPREVDDLLALPGFGRYTSGAVSSIAYGREAPLVDGNVARVFARLFLIEGASGDRPREQLLWTIATQLVKGPRPGDFNQSLMELGATVCVPANPLCLLCPVAAQCRALATGRAHELPSPKRPAARKRLELVVAVARKKTRLVLAHREEAGLFGGLWELPSATGLGEAPLRQLLGARAEIGPELLVVERTLTHRDLVMHLHPVELPARLPRAPKGYQSWKWVERSELTQLGVSSATEAAIAAALGK